MLFNELNKGYRKITVNDSPGSIGYIRLDSDLLVDDLGHTINDCLISGLANINQLQNTNGIWLVMCPKCFWEHGVAIGTGKGTAYKKNNEGIWIETDIVPTK